jgi:hypothetical protein
VPAPRCGLQLRLLFAEPPSNNCRVIEITKGAIPHHIAENLPLLRLLEDRAI